MDSIEKPKIEVADIFNQFGHLMDPLSKEQYKVVQDIKNCRTKVLGGHSLECSECNFTKNEYNSCRNRHCPKCQYLSRIKWIEKRKEDLLLCQYFHVVFTIPDDLNPLILQNKEVCYNILFKASSKTLKEVAANPKNLGAEIGFFGILHTWAQNLIDHPHIHFIVPGGGFGKKDEWISCKKDYLLPVQILSVVFRGKFLNYLELAYKENKLKFLGQVEHLKEANNFKKLLAITTKHDWVVYAKEPFAGPEQVINYLGQYTHRIAISNYRLEKIEDGKVSFKCRDNSDKNKKKIVTLDGTEFIRRFLLHVLPKRFVKIRHFGFLGNRLRKEKLPLYRKLHNIAEKVTAELDELKIDWKENFKALSGIDLNICPVCKKGIMIEKQLLPGVLNSS
ncbi:MAG: IS91 family transposase [Oligoflexia bacterium]|nr:IS91 family transposase [Oligoflexia bacterium]